MHLIVRTMAMMLTLEALPLGSADAGAAGECFCLHHLGTDAMLRGCTALKGPNDAFTTADCVDPETGFSSKQLIGLGWERIDPGANDCTPCRPAPRRTSERPRGDSDKAVDGGPASARGAPAPMETDQDKR